jgi:ketosteroid isomerase-like protein
MNGWPQAELRVADRSFFQALLDRDVGTLETLLADQFLIVEVGGGSVHDRAAFLGAIGSGAVSFDDIETFPAETVIRMAGDGAGIVVGRTAMSFSDAEGHITAVSSRYTHVFQSDGRSWRLVSAQGTRISNGQVRLRSQGSVRRAARARRAGGATGGHAGG